MSLTALRGPVILTLICKSGQYPWTCHSPFSISTTTLNDTRIAIMSAVMTISRLRQLKQQPQPQHTVGFELDVPTRF